MTLTKEILPLGLRELNDPVASRWYLAAMIDGEGWVSQPPGSPRMDISNTQIEIISVSQQCLDVLGIKYSTGGPFQPKNPEHTPYFTIRIGFRYMQVVAEIIPVQCPVKRSKLMYWLEQPRKTIYLDERPLAEVKKLYEEDMLSLRKIAIIFDVGSETIRRWLIHSGVSMRTREEAIQVSWDQGHVRCSYTDEQFIQARDLYRNGNGLESIGKIMGFDRDVIRRILTEGDVKIRSHSEAVVASNRRRPSVVS